MKQRNIKIKDEYDIDEFNDGDVLPDIVNTNINIDIDIHNELKKHLINYQHTGEVLYGVGSDADDHESLHDMYRRLLETVINYLDITI